MQRQSCYEGAAAFLKAHAAEEMEHMQRLFNYYSDTDAPISLLRAIDAPPSEFSSVSDIFTLTLET